MRYRQNYPELAADEAYAVALSPAPCSLDIGDGSERGAYVNQDYIFRTLRSRHRCVNLMYCYYPLDKGWPKRASVAFPPTEHTRFAWAYPYDDYFPYEGGPGRRKGQHPFEEMRDIRRHGQDVTLSLAIDCGVSDKHLKTIAKELAPFGRLRVRINHECDGGWFAFNKRYSHKEISDFFRRFSDILKAESPQIQTICCFGTIDKHTGRLKHGRDLLPMLADADIWSVDKYLFLHYKWPFGICEEGQLDTGYSHPGLEYVWEEMKTIYGMFVESAGLEKPLEICEFNGDGDVPGGRAYQAEQLALFYKRVLAERPAFLKGITYYQFRDQGRLGLEQEDPNNPTVGIEAPFLEEYRKILKKRYFQPKEKWDRSPDQPPLRWRAADDCEGAGWQVTLEGKPTFLELKFEKEANLALRVGDVWFYKRPGVEWVDATRAGESAPGAIKVLILGPPASGENGHGVSFVEQRLRVPPRIRVRYAS